MGDVKNFKVQINGEDVTPSEVTSFLGKTPRWWEIMWANDEHVIVEAVCRFTGVRFRFTVGSFSDTITELFKHDPIGPNLFQADYSGQDRSWVYGNG